MNLTVPLTISPWLEHLLVDPISKKPFIARNAEAFWAPCGFEYRYKNGVPDFRVRLGMAAREWLDRQITFEAWIDDYFNAGEADPEFYRREQERDRPMYEELKLSGRVLDVGGQLGHIRKYMDSDQEYCSIDPFIEVHMKAKDRANLFANYPLSTPLNFIGGYAEFLPFKDGSFDTINMRSCIDHFCIPEIALLEAYRVLTCGGKLIIGVSLEGQSWKAKIKEFVRPMVSLFVHRYKDHHVWHPTYDGLIDLYRHCGFGLEKAIWQSENILYASFRRCSRHLIAVG